MNNIISVSFLALLFIVVSNSKHIPDGYYTGGVVTYWPSTTKPSVEIQSEKNSKSSTEADAQHEPGWMRKQLLRFGQAASKVGNAMGAHANKISAALDKICEVIKTVIPLLAAVCHVGQFGFCSATNEAPIKLVEAMNPAELDLDSLDR
ncbi:uncharacterized protein LOC109535967 [Dendroctonus ponderosae]